MDILRQGLSTQEAQFLTALSGNGRDIFTTRDAQILLAKPDAAVRKTMHRLMKRKWVQQIERGRYLIVPLSAGVDAHYTISELVIAASFTNPYYLSYRTAFVHYSWTEQPSRTVYIVTPNRRAAANLNGITYAFVTIAPRKFFGSAPTWIGDKVVEIADKEKALVDGLDHPEYCGGIIEVAKAVWHARDEIDWDKLGQYARRMGSGALCKRLGYLTELFELGNKVKTGDLCNVSSAGYALLDPLAGHEGGYNSRWKLRLNIPENALTDWRES